MSIDDAPAGPVAAPAEPAPTSALGGHRARTRRLRLWYYPIVALVVAAAASFSAVVMSHGEIAHAHLHSAASAAPSLSSGSPSRTQALAWRTSDALASGVPLWGGTVVTFSTHTVTGRNAGTGAAVWTYSRSDLSICEVIQQQGKTFAFFVRDGNCDEIDAFDTPTGHRAAVQGTLDSNGQPTDGIPAFASNQYTLLLTTKQQVHAIDPATGYDRWNTAAPAGCTDLSSVLGADGVLISQQCADGDYLELRDPYASDQVDDNPNPKAVTWRVRTTASLVPVSADQLTSALDAATGQLMSFDGKGAVDHTVTLAGIPTSTRAVPVTSSSGIDLLWAGGNAYGIDTFSGQQRWRLSLVGPPTLGSSLLLAPTSGGVGVLDGAAGSVADTYELPEAAPGSLVYSAGTGFLIGRGPTSGPVPTLVYR